MNNEPKQISRRDFLKLSRLVPALAVGSAVAVVARKELPVIISGTFESEGIRYQPMYEEHSEGPQILLNNQANGLFIEAVRDHTMIKGNLDNTFETKKYSHYDMNVIDLVDSLLKSKGRIDMINKATRMKIPLAFGDIDTGEFQEDVMDLLKFTTEEDRRKFYGGLLVAASSFFPEGLRGTIAKRLNKPMTRREFLKKGATMFVAALGSTYGGWLSTDTSFFDDLTVQNANLENQTNPYNRFLIRLHGFVKDIHTFPPAIFTRNLIMALKIKQFGKYLKSKGVDYPLTAFNVGAAHSGIEDFICLPEELLRELIVKINKDYVGKSLSKYGDLFSSTRIIQADNKGQYKDIAIFKDEKLQKMLTS